MTEWKRHRGSKSMPKCLEGNDFVLRLRNGIKVKSCGYEFWCWCHSGSEADIMAYQVVKQEPAKPDYSKGFPEGTTAKDIGAKVGDQFVVVMQSEYALVGEIATLVIDDGSKLPKFSFSKSETSYFHWKWLAPIQQKSAIEQQEASKQQPEADGWIEWKGGECPVEKGTLVDVRYVDGHEEFCIQAGRPSGFGHARSAVSWSAALGVLTIRAYRLHQPQEWPENRVDIVGQNGNDGLHYVDENDTSPEHVEKHEENVHITPESLTLRDIAPALKAAGVKVMLEDDPRNAVEFLDYARKTLTQRGKDYDKPEGERSAAAVAVAFNAITGRNLAEAEVWLVLQLVKDVRQWQNPERYHADSALDCVAYAALKAEALAGGAK